MAEKLSLRTNANGDIYVYVEDTSGASLAFGSDSSNGIIALNTLNIPNVQPLESTANMTIDPAINGDILFRPHGTGKSEFNTGNVQISASNSIGNFVIPDCTSLNQGYINQNAETYMHNAPGAGASNMYVGVNAGNFASVNNNVGIGANALSSVVGGGFGSHNVAVGSQAGASLTEGEENVFIGYNAGTFVDTESASVYIGSNAYGLAQNGFNNVAIGRQSMYQASFADNCVSIGANSLSNLGSGSSNIAIGSLSGNNFVGAESDNILIGNAGVGGESGSIRIGGGLQTTAFMQGIHSITPAGAAQRLMIIDSSGQMGTTTGGSFIGLTVIHTESGDATVSAGAATITGGNNIGTSGAGSTVTINVDNIVGQTNGGASIVPFVATGTGNISETPGGAVTMNTSTQSLTISGDAAATTVNVATGAAAKTVTVGSTSSTSLLALKYGTADFTLASATGTIMSALDTGEITYPFQSSFQAYRSADVANVTGDGTTYTCTMDTELFDRNSDYNNSTYTFTAPVTGLYFFSLTVGGANLAVTHTLGLTQIVTTAHTYSSNYSNWGLARAVNNIFMYTHSILTSMTAGDTAVTNFGVYSSTKTVTFYGGNTNSVLCGWLVA